MNKLFIYYSHTGNGELVGDVLKNKGYELRKVEEKKKMPKLFFFKMLVGGFRAGLSLKGKLINYDSNVESYDEIIIGTPIWNGKLPPAINKVLEETNLKDKKLSFIIYSGSGNGPKALKKINKLFGDISVIFLKEPKKYFDELNKIKEL